MSRFGVWLVEQLNRMVPPQPMHQELSAAKVRDADYQKRDYEEAALIVPVFGTHWEVVGKRVLDVGGGLGGKSAYCLDQGARQAISLDMRTYSNQAASRLARQGGLAHPETPYENLHPLTADAAYVPFPDDAFEVILSVNAFEHIDNLRQTLCACKRVLHPQGLMFLYFPPFYSPWGAHLEGWINFPWPHVFFSDATLIRAAERVEARLSRNENYISPSQVDWAHAERLPELNRITARAFLALVRETGWRIVAARMLPFGWHTFAQRGKGARAFLALLNWIAQLPLAREVIATKMAFVLEK